MICKLTNSNINFCRRSHAAYCYAMQLASRNNIAKQQRIMCISYFQDIDNKKLLAITLLMKAHLNTICYRVYAPSVKYNNYCCPVLHYEKLYFNMATYSYINGNLTTEVYQGYRIISFFKS